MGITGAVIGAGVAGLAGAGISAVGANAAANTQAGAATTAAGLQAQTANNSLLLQGNSLNTNIANQQPWYQSGEGALSQLDALMGITPGAPAQGVQIPGMPGSGPGGTGAATSNTPQAGGSWVPQSDGGSIYTNYGPDNPSPTSSSTTPAGVSAGGQFSAAAPGTTATDASGNPTGGATSTSPLMQTWNQTFQSPTSVTEQNDPGYQFRLQQGLDAVQNSAAARGGLLSGGTAKGMDQFAQGDASSEYQNVYNRALQNYSTNYNTFQSNQANQYNRLAALAGTGQTSANQISNNLTQGTNTAATTMGNAANAIGQNINNAGAATASGYVGAANAGSSALSSLGSTAGQYAIMQNLLNNSNSGLSYGTNPSQYTPDSTGAYLAG